MKTKYDKERYSKVRSLRFTDADWELLRKQGEYFGLNRAKYIRFLLRAPLIIPEDRKAEKQGGEWI